MMVRREVQLLVFVLLRLAQPFAILSSSARNNNKFATTSTRSLLAASTAVSPEAVSSSTSVEKHRLLESISRFKSVTARDGVVPIDFGVTGGELESQDRTPRDLLTSGAFREVSKDVGDAADAVKEAIDVLATKESLAVDATKFFGTREGALCPLHGGWRSLWTTSADATFSKTSKRGDALVGNIVDATKGTITNVITFLADDRKIDQLRVAIKATPVSKTKLRLTFRSATLKFRKRFLGLFKTLTIPVPAVTFTRIIFFFRRKKTIPKPPFFEVLYLDHDLRIQRTGDGNLFVQQKISPNFVGF